MNVAYSCMSMDRIWSTACGTSVACWKTGSVWLICCSRIQVLERSVSI